METRLKSWSPCNGSFNPVPTRCCPPNDVFLNLVVHNWPVKSLLPYLDIRVSLETQFLHLCISYYNLFQFLSFHLKDVYFRFLANKPVFNSIQLWFFSQAFFRILNEGISESGKKQACWTFFHTPACFFFLSLIVIMAFNRFCRIPSFLGLWRNLPVDSEWMRKSPSSKPPCVASLVPFADKMS